MRACAGIFCLVWISLVIFSLYSVCLYFVICFFFFKQKTAYEMRISDWSSDVCSSDLLSGTTVTWAHHALQQGDRKGLVQGLTLTVILGLLFTSCQAFEYSHAAFGFTDGIYASTFYMATGFHGFHVIVGTIFLIVCLVRAMKGQDRKSTRLNSSH